jgi:hypothetical protein
MLLANGSLLLKEWYFMILQYATAALYHHVGPPLVLVSMILQYATAALYHHVGPPLVLVSTLRILRGE